MSGVGNIAMFGGDLVMNQLKFLKNKPYCAIKKTILYQYEKKGGREATDKFNIAQISAIALIKKKDDEINLQETLGVDKIFGGTSQTAQF